MIFSIRQVKATLATAAHDRQTEMPTALGKRLFLARSKRGYTMEQLGLKAKVHPSTINGIEKGRNDPGTVTTSKLAKALEIDPCWLAYGTGVVPDWQDKAQ